VAVSAVPVSTPGVVESLVDASAGELLVESSDEHATMASEPSNKNAVRIYVLLLYVS
jgi:hypothetical protein